MERQYNTFKAYGTDGKLRLVGGGVPPHEGKNLGIRWEIGRVEHCTFQDAYGARVHRT